MSGCMAIVKEVQRDPNRALFRPSILNPPHHIKPNASFFSRIILLASYHISQTSEALSSSIVCLMSSPTNVGLYRAQESTLKLFDWMGIVNEVQRELNLVL